ncbi:hypothetical protein PV10_07881 [Exophiala mesophila]|uniref:Uncharacterized protein n=1 Tax=Exophiala mesophila TaxID=212818 RepID=A0A0D1XR86_EXOME|nr:uncharacterized protein PV10_07881 [Exophiala mesophila]KIV90596.1 hypothetical protein PV10_07881 [Exophiala mesophila]
MTVGLGGLKIRVTFASVLGRGHMAGKSEGKHPGCARAVAIGLVASSHWHCWHLAYRGQRPSGNEPDFPLWRATRSGRRMRSCRLEDALKSWGYARGNRLDGRRIQVSSNHL